MRKIIAAIALSCSFFSASAQSEWGVLAGGGTSWIILPKVFLVDPQDARNVWAVSPGANSVAAHLAVDYNYRLNENWHMGTGAALSYTSGSIKITSLALQATSTEIQSYLRLDIPLFFGVRSADNLWFNFGPGIFFNLYDNQGVNKAIDNLTSADNVNTVRRVGVNARFALGFYISDNLFLNIMFISDFGRKFYYENDTYQIRMSMQNISVGLGWALGKK